MQLFKVTGINGCLIPLQYRQALKLMLWHLNKLLLLLKKVLIEKNNALIWFCCIKTKSSVMGDKEINGKTKCRGIAPVKS